MELITSVEFEENGRIWVTESWGMDGVVYSVGHWIYLFQQDIWPLQIVLKLFFAWYLPILIALMILKFVLGHRAPGHHNAK